MLLAVVDDPVVVNVVIDDVAVDDDDAGADDSLGLGTGCCAHGRQVSMSPAIRITATTAAAAAITRDFPAFLLTDSPSDGTAPRAGLVGAVCVGAPTESICSLRARAKSEQRLNRSSGRLARPMASTWSSLQARVGCQPLLAAAH